MRVLTRRNRNRFRIRSARSRVGTRTENAESAEAGPVHPSPSSPSSPPRNSEPEGQRSEHRARRAKRRRRIKIALLAITATTALGAATVFGLAAWDIQHLTKNLKHTALLPPASPSPPSRSTPTAAPPINILLIGSDTRDTSADCGLGGDCGTGANADSEMIVHLSADRSNATVLSIPRDTETQLPAARGGGRAMINSALQYGASCQVAAVVKLTGITIDHYMMFDFSGVVDLSNELGGVPVCVARVGARPELRPDDQRRDHQRRRASRRCSSSVPGTPSTTAPTSAASRPRTSSCPRCCARSRPARRSRTSVSCSRSPRRSPSTRPSTTASTARPRCSASPTTSARWTRTAPPS